MLNLQIMCLIKSHTWFLFLFFLRKEDILQQWQEAAGLHADISYLCIRTINLTRSLHFFSISLVTVDRFHLPACTQVSPAHTTEGEKNAWRISIPFHSLYIWSHWETVQYAAAWLYLTMRLKLKLEPFRDREENMQRWKCEWLKLVTCSFFSNSNMCF